MAGEAELDALFEIIRSALKGKTINDLMWDTMNNRIEIEVQISPSKIAHVYWDVGDAIASLLDN
jgi:hypothetical protein